VWIARLWRRVRVLVSVTHDRELRDELQLHLDLLTEEYVSQGVPPAEARARAQRDFGNATRIQETSHDLFAFRGLEQLLKDVNYAAREIKRSPWFTAVAVLSLAVGIAAVTTTASVVDALLLRGLPVHEPERLVAVSRGNATPWSRWRYGDFRQWSDAPDAPFRVAAVYTLNDLERPLLPATDAEPLQSVRVSLVSGGYFDVLGISMAAGRPILPDDDRLPGGHPVAVISHSYWARQFGQSEGIIGHTLILNDVSYQVIGVASERFAGEWVGQPTDVWLPLTMHAAITRSRAALLRDDSPAQWLRVIARLDDETSVVQATAFAEVIRQRSAVGKAMPQSQIDATRDPVVLTSAAGGYAPARQQYSRPLMIVAVVVGIVIVVACANFSSLLYGRSRSRQMEYAVRLALGAGRWRIVRQLLVECILLASVSAVLGVVAAAWVTTGALKSLPATLQPIDLDLRLDARVLGVTVGCTTLVVMVGLISSLRSLRDPALSLARATIRQRRRNLVGRLFLVGQLALCVVLLIGTGLMLRTIHNLRTQHLGFDRNLLLVTVAPRQAGYTGDAASLLVQQIRGRLLALRDVRGVSTTGAGLMDSRTYWIDGSERLAVEGRPPVSGASWTFADVGPGFFQTIGMPIVRGRDFTEADVLGPSDAVIINQSMASLLFGVDDPLGQRLGMSPTSPKLSVVGVVNDARQTSPRDRGLPVLYRPLQHVPPQVVLAVRTQGNAAESVDVVRHQLFDMDRNLPIVTVQTVEALLDHTIGQERSLAALATWLGLLIVVVSCVGLHALMSNDVVERTHELGVRMALGATRERIAGLVLRDAATVATLAIAAGIPLALAAVTPLASQLYGVESNDPGIILLAALLLLLVALIAAGRPARVAAGVEPVVLLRAD
jgi:predicted permease